MEKKLSKLADVDKDEKEYFKCLELALYNSTTPYEVVKRFENLIKTLFTKLEPSLIQNSENLL